MLATLASLLLPVAQDAAEEGKKIITWMLIVGLVFLGVILVGEGFRYLGQRRKARARAQAAQPPPYRRV
jgi:heme/copper-type cytochrome/quinol oxidase subunit 2